MKKTILMVICFLLLVTITTKETKAFYEDNELSQITKIAVQNNIQVNTWSMYIKEPIKQFTKMSDLDKAVAVYMETEKEFTWSKEQAEKGYYKIEGQKKSSKLGLKEEKVLITIYSQNNKYNLSITYDIKGKWNESKWPAIYNLYKQKIEDYSVFYTIQGTANIDQSLYIEASKVMASFSGEEVQSLKEENFISLSAYTKRWENKLSIGNNEYMNLHIAYRATSQSTDQVDVTIGTPIITSEY
ncbi:YwmB family TATA-box binding protein [Niallia taxi]|uniref:YwmB family TATA-box binding protein n=1 Tax=Niallia taxi TaxID=2499688 RepID=UPI0011A48E2C|nr:YwmB family TATA-box binding protein [Niallia taxi]MDE5054154.1 YwmB family TATA-box binding protein [Niallia taxi]MED3961202.1 YwmB family TATA-box binding protein [Niallia taxi]